MPKHEGNAHGKHYTEDEQQDDAQRNHNLSTGRQHFEADADEKAGGHSDRHADSDSTQGRQHDLRDPSNDDDVNRHAAAQSEDHPQGAGRKTGGHQAGRHQGGNTRS